MRPHSIRREKPLQQPRSGDDTSAPPAIQVPLGRRRGVAILAFVVAMLVIGSMALMLFQATATSSRSALSHYYGTGAFYAAESGLEMTLRELNLNPPTGNDSDSDGGIGTISDNGNAADDPALTTGSFFVEQVSVSPATFRATGRPAIDSAPWSEYSRTIEIVTE